MQATIPCLHVVSVGVDEQRDALLGRLRKVRFSIKVADDAQNIDPSEAGPDGSICGDEDGLGAPLTLHRFGTNSSPDQHDLLSAFNRFSQSL